MSVVYLPAGWLYVVAVAAHYRMLLRVPGSSVLLVRGGGGGWGSCRPSVRCARSDKVNVQRHGLGASECCCRSHAVGPLPAGAAADGGGSRFIDRLVGPQSDKTPKPLLAVAQIVRLPEALRHHVPPARQRAIVFVTTGCCAGLEA
jgi:hypothetical protein